MNCLQTNVISNKTIYAVNSFGSLISQNVKIIAIAAVALAIFSAVAFVVYNYCKKPKEALIPFTLKATHQSATSGPQKPNAGPSKGQTQNPIL